MVSLIHYICRNVPLTKYFGEAFEQDLSQYEGTNEDPRFSCPFHEDSTPSFHVNMQSGAYFCHGCDAKGGDLVAFEAAYSEVSQSEAARRLYSKYIRPTIDESVVDAWSDTLGKTPSLISFIKGRNVTSEVAREYRLGYDGNRITIPVFNEFGLCVNAKKYDPSPKGKKFGKMISHRDVNEPRKFGKTFVFPYHAFELAKLSNYLMLCEGEWDTLVLLSIGIPAITMTGGSKTWCDEVTHMFSGLDIVLAYDNDNAGREGEKIAIKKLRRVAKTLRSLEVPKKFGSDVRDWVTKSKLMKKRSSWERLFNKLEPIAENEGAEPTQVEVIEVPLSESTSEKYVGKSVKVRASISGKLAAALGVPVKFEITCEPIGEACATCPSKAQSGAKTCDVDLDTKVALELIGKPWHKVKSALLASARIPKASSDCNLRVEVLRETTFEHAEVSTVPGDGSKNYVNRECYIEGHDIPTNRSYELTGRVFTDPGSGKRMQVFRGKRPIKSTAESFEMTPEIAAQLQVFKCENEEDPTTHLDDIAQWMSTYVTNIRGREDLHTLVDLVFHSVREFDFNGEHHPRGMLDALVVGDTRCGKGRVSSTMSNYYGLGEVVPGENTSIAGLVGGAVKMGESWFIKWGAIPINNGGLVVIDELSGMSKSDIGRLSRVRSEGIAEVGKIVTARCDAKARLLMLSNPRNGLAMGSYLHGVESLPDLMGANEDVARLDIAMGVMSGEVDQDTIQTTPEQSQEEANRFTRQACRNLILWVWSRTRGQVIFRPDAVKLTLSSVRALARTYSSRISLVQVEDMRFKIAKIAAAIACRCFSTDDSFEKVVVTRHHVHAAVLFFEKLYNSVAFDYLGYSVRFNDSQSSTDYGDLITELAAMFQRDDRHMVSFLRSVISSNNLTSTAVCNYSGMSSMFSSEVMGKMNATGALMPNPTNISAPEVNPNFREYVQELTGDTYFMTSMSLEERIRDIRKRKFSTKTVKTKIKRKKK